MRGLGAISLILVKKLDLSHPDKKEWQADAPPDSYDKVDLSLSRNVEVASLAGDTLQVNLFLLL